MTLTHRTKNTWHIGSKNSSFNVGDTLTILNRTDGVEIFAARALGVLDYTWCCRYKNGKVHAVITVIPNSRGGQTTIFLHRLIMENVPHRPEQTEIDHIDGNPLNNHPDNLRWVTSSVNHHNQRDANGMPRRGVSRTPWRGGRPWRAQIGRLVDSRYRVENKCFPTARAAEDQYLIWKRQYHPETPEIWYEQYAACQASGYWD